MNVIKFSHQYSKLPKKLPFEATLVQVLRCHYRDLSECFKKYDTEFISVDEPFYYTLPDKELIVLVLLFVDCEDIFDVDVLFTTVRSYDEEKFRYYKGLEGQKVSCVQS